MTRIPEAAARELDEWPGVTARLEHGGKHDRLVLGFEGRERFVVIPSTPSDSRRGDYNKVRDLRANLSLLGATRNERAKSTTVRQRNRPERDPLASVPLAPVKPDPWAILKGLFMERTITINGKQITLQSGVPIPPKAKLAGRAKSDFRLLLEAMKPGESFYLTDANLPKKSVTLTATGKQTGNRYTYRREAEGYRVYCTTAQKPVETRANGAVNRQPERGLVSSWL